MIQSRWQFRRRRLSLRLMLKCGAAGDICFADGTWNSDVSEDWLDINPKSGDKNTEVTVTILSDNIDASGKLNAPREAVITFRGSSSVRQGQVYVTQKGDNYLGVDEYTVTEAVKLDDEAKVKIPSATVMAVSKVGFVLSDGTTTVYAEGAKDVKCGDKVSLNGSVANSESLSESRLMRSMFSHLVMLNIRIRS